MNKFHQTSEKSLTKLDLWKPQQSGSSSGWLCCYHDNPAVHNIHSNLTGPRTAQLSEMYDQCRTIPIPSSVSSQVKNLQVTLPSLPSFISYDPHCRLSALTATGGRFTLATLGRMSSRASARTTWTTRPRSAWSTTPRTGRRTPSSLLRNGEKLLPCLVNESLPLTVCVCCTAGVRWKVALC